MHIKRFDLNNMLIQPKRRGGRIMHAAAWMAVLVLASCEPNRIFEQNQSVGKEWAWDDARRFEVDIRDTVSLYHLFVNVRHTERYGYANCWLLINTIGPAGDTLRSRIEIKLAEPDGTWLGECNTSMCMQRELIGADQRFPLKGRYIFELEQDMRQNPLPGITDVGIRLEKLAPVPERLRN